MRISILDLAKKFGCFLIYLFGSQAEAAKQYLEGEEIHPEPFSDLDVAVAFRNILTIPINRYGELYRDLSEMFGPFDIDLVIIHEMNPLFQYEIIKGIRVYEEDERITEEFEEGVMKKAGDLIIKKRILDHEIMEAIENGYFEFEYRADP